MSEETRAPDMGSEPNPAPNVGPDRATTRDTAPEPNAELDPAPTRESAPEPDHEPGSAAPERGVGPWPGGPENWPDGDQWDRELLANGDARNVIDKYRYWTVEAIRADLDSDRHSFHVAIENFHHDSNIGSVVRSANAFGAQAVHVVGRKRWNRRGAMVTDRYQHIHHHESVDAFLEWARAEGIAVVGIDITSTSTPMEGYAFPKECILVFGQESTGLSAQMTAGCDDVVHITQYGSTRSINVGAAAAVAMWAWVQSERA